MTAVEWLDRWFRDNPEATHEEGNNALNQAKEMEKQQMEISDEEIKKEASRIHGVVSMFFIDGAKWYREQLKQRKYDR